MPIGLAWSMPPKARAISPLTKQKPWQKAAKGKIESVLLLVDQPIARVRELTESIKPDRYQFHGTESVEYLTQLNLELGLPLIKSFAIAQVSDGEKAQSMAPYCDYFLFDSPKTAGDSRHGGLGRSFDWNLLKNQHFTKPIILAGGLNETNVAAAIQNLRPFMVDVSSGVESENYQKSPEKIKRFVQEVKKLHD